MLTHSACNWYIFILFEQTHKPLPITRNGRHIFPLFIIIRFPLTFSYGTCTFEALLFSVPYGSIYLTHTDPEIFLKCTYTHPYTHKVLIFYFLSSIFPSPLPFLWLEEGCLFHQNQSDPFWMWLWTWWGQSEWYMAVIPLLQHDTAVSCHGRLHDL